MARANRITRPRPVNPSGTGSPRRISADHRSTARAWASAGDQLEVEAAGVPVAGELAVAVDVHAERLVAGERVVAVRVGRERDTGDAEAGGADRLEAGHGGAV